MVNNLSCYHFENIFLNNPKSCGGIYLYQLGEMICQPTTVVAAHEQMFYEIMYVISGHGVVIHDDEKMQVQKGDCVLSFPGDLHQIESNPKDALRYGFVAFMDDGTGKIFPTIFEEMHRVFDGMGRRLMNMPQQNNFFFKLFSELNSEEFFTLEMIGICIASFLVEAIRTYKKENSIYYSPQIKNESLLTYQIIAYLNGHIFEIKNLNQLAEVFNYNYRYITRCFKNQTGESLNDYFIRNRMNYAKELLNEKYSVTQISELLSYSSIHVFTRCFKKHFGYTPTEYRAMIKNNP